MATWLRIRSLINPKPIILPQNKYRSFKRFVEYTVSSQCLRYPANKILNFYSVLPPIRGEFCSEMKNGIIRVFYDYVN